jgi:hypothetical protein
MSANLVVMVHPRGRRLFLVKVGVQTDLREEFDGLRAGHATFPQGVPRPLALSIHRSFPTLVVEGIDFVPLAARAFTLPTARLRTGIATFFATAHAAFARDVPPAHAARVRDALAALGGAVAQDVAARYAEAVASTLDALPAIAQHGDFYPGNLGLRDTGLVVLDWEDFGREWLPGFDAALLLLSLNDFDVLALHASLAPCARHAWIGAALHAGTGIEPRTLLALLPAYLALLLRMKVPLGYGEAFEARALGALRASLDLGDGDRSMA